VSGAGASRASRANPVTDAVHGGLGHRIRHQLPLLVWLVLVWILLWGTWSWANLLSGALVSVLVTTLLPLPPVVGGTRFRPVAFVHYLGYFAVDLLLSGAQVAWRTLSPRGIRNSAILEVRLRTDSDLLLTIVAESVTLVPGSLVIDLDREEKSVALHVLHVDGPDDVERARSRVLAMEERVVRAFGTVEEIAALRHEVGLAPPSGTAGSTP
jgi:multicomponent Na+:H+ antiporter subunit E